DVTTLPVAPWVMVNASEATRRPPLKTPKEPESTVFSDWSFSLAIAGAARIARMSRLQPTTVATWNRAGPERPSEARESNRRPACLRSGGRTFGWTSSSSTSETPLSRELFLNMRLPGEVQSTNNFIRDYADNLA